MKNIIIDIVLAEMIFRQPKAVNLRSPQRHLTQLQRGRGVKEVSVCRPALQAARRQASLINTMPATSRITPAQPLLFRR